MKLAPNDVEAALAAACAGAAIWKPAAGRTLFRAILRLLRPLDRRPALAAALVILLPAALRVALLPSDPAPLPRTMEEYNHLLQAATYAKGRITNPTHPLAVLFNQFQIVEWPHRVSARPPACPLFFWIGDVLFRSPWVGNLLSIALAAGLIYWMLLGWTRRRWAILGALLIVIRYCVFGYWMNSFWGASVPLIGGILVLGVAPRIRKGPKLWHALVFSVGAALLAGSRPYEGAIMLLPVGAFLLLWLARARKSGRLAPDLRNFVLLVAAASVLIVAAQLRYDQITTGRATLMPYQVWRNAQTTVPAFLWQPLSRQRLIFYYPQARLFQEWEELVGHRHESLRRTFLELAIRHGITLREIVGPMMLLPFLCWSAVWFRRHPGRPALFLLLAATVAAEFCFALSEHRVWAPRLLIPAAAAAGIALLLRRRPADRLPVAVIFAGALATTISSFYMTNYMLPFVCAFLVIIVGGLRNLSLWDRRRGTGASLAGFLIAGSAAMFALTCATCIAGFPLYDRLDLGRYDYPPFTDFRKATDYLTRLGGRHLVFVRYGNNYLSTNEYVWNGPDIDSQNIVWARDLRPEWTAAAIQYYKGRRVWLLDRPDERGPQFEPYPVRNLPPPEPLDRLPMPYREQASK